MTFGLSNAGETFQRAMDLAFVGKVKKIIVIYLDEITVFFKCLRCFGSDSEKTVKPSR